MMDHSPDAVEDRSKPLTDWVDTHRTEIVELLRTLVRIPSITGNEAAIGAFVVGFCRDLGFVVDVFEELPGRPNIVAVLDSGLPGPTLLLNDHLDMIPPGPLEAWTYPPFAAEIHNGQVFGRGTIDTKSGLTTILATATAIVARKFPFCGKLKLIFSCDEEVGGRHGMQFLGRLGLITADLALVTEPTSMQVEIATKGRLNLEIVTHGLATHGARPWLGHNAIEDMMAVIAELQTLGAALRTRIDPLLGSASLNVGIIQGGTVPNMVPNRCRIEVDRRLLPSETPEDAMSEIHGLLAGLAAKNQNFRCDFSQLLWWPGYSISRNEPVVALMSEAVEAVTGALPIIRGKDAGTDASWIHILGGIPVVMFSPGDGPRAMNADESVSIDDLILATKVVARFTSHVLTDGLQ
ncbi:MAG: M20 family metallopeptidase [Pseudorhodoplanes sp.]